jgi:hypothetical protein
MASERNRRQSCIKPPGFAGGFMRDRKRMKKP